MYSHAIVNISKVQADGSLLYLDGKYENKRNCWVLLENLEAGEYVV